jgi:ribosomal subunit interface protein
LRVDAEHKHDFVASARAGDLWRSINGAVQKIEQQLRKYKERVTERHRAHGARQQGVAAGE